MDPSFNAASRFCYSQGQDAMGETEAGGGDGGFSGLLEVYVHHARNIHNICIYANQDVYAKFSLTCSPDDVLSTSVVAGGGKNPQFDERLATIKVPHPDAVLKCEIWMLSRARNFLEDQLLGFALVPLSSVAAAAKRKLTQDFTLSSTDLFHSPAGTVQLTLYLHSTSDKHSFALESSSNHASSITSEVVILDPEELGTIEFPDVNIAKENQKMVSQYFDMAAAHAPSSPPRAAAAAAPFQFTALLQSVDDYDMAANSSDDNIGGSDSPDGSIGNSGPFTASTTTSLSDDRNSADSTEKKNRQEVSDSAKVETGHSGGTNSPDTPTSKCGAGAGDGKEDNKLSSMEKVEDRGKEQHDIDSVFKSPMGNINLEAEQSAMQQQIVDMYMRSMQQFTESLAKMKLPMDLDVPKAEDGGDVIQTQTTGDKLDQQQQQQQQKKKDGSRVFYGSRAFF
ncbi:uncharacterized protein M6B38_348520 [Iris pallida]|uniref:C2 domain-containing protein n=1 Tax=Iris pallida TaxID=29817 RepID=A0AAX6GRU5_IRIPA|nr:uncharacterized protein M6B38_348520 [Iris pallida]